jgi:pimeloyl-ACP methyl ester carboxylesterase
MITLMPLMEVNGTRIHYLQIDCESDRNSGDDCPDLVMVHGLATNLSFWYMPFALSFARHFRVTLYDLRGHGRSSIAERGYTAADMALDLQHLLVRLNIEQAHFVAHSFGGAVALNLACTNPGLFAGLVLADTHIRAMRRQPAVAGADRDFREKLRSALARCGIAIDVDDQWLGLHLLDAAALLRMENIEFPDELANSVGPWMSKSSKRTARQWLQVIRTTRAAQEIMADDGLSADRLRRFYFPIMAMYAEGSPAMASGEFLRQVWRHACFVRIGAGGHFFPLRHPELFMKNCRSFWSGN